MLKFLHKIDWLIFIIIIWAVIMGGLFWLWTQYRKRNVGVSRVVIIGVIVINALICFGIYVVLKN